jgi:hypothetical protein
MMDWNELRNDWQARSDRTTVDLDLRPDERERLWRRVRIRDRLETPVALLLVPLFGFAAVTLARAGLWIPAAFSAGLVAVLIYIPLRLRRARREIPGPDPGLSVLAFLDAERSALTAQADMLRSVARWYSGPVCIGVVGFFVSLAGPSIESLLYTLFVAALFVAIEVMNRVAVRKRFEPAIEQLDEQISILNQES